MPKHSQKWKSEGPWTETTPSRGLLSLKKHAEKEGAKKKQARKEAEKGRKWREWKAAPSHWDWGDKGELELSITYDGQHMRMRRKK